MEAYDAYIRGKIDAGTLNRWIERKATDAQADVAMRILDEYIREEVREGQMKEPWWRSRDVLGRFISMAEAVRRSRISRSLKRHWRKRR